MLELKNRNLEAILKAHPLREAILTTLHRNGFAPATFQQPVSKLDENSFARLHDAALDALLNSGIIVESYEAEQDKGAYSINIIGVPGAYYVEAPEYDDLGVFDTLEDARRALEFAYGEFILSGPT